MAPKTYGIYVIRSLFKTHHLLHSGYVDPLLFNNFGILLMKTFYIVSLLFIYVIMPTFGKCKTFLPGCIRNFVLWFVYYYFFLIFCFMFYLYKYIFIFVNNNINLDQFENTCLVTYKVLSELYSNFLTNLNIN